MCASAPCMKNSFPYREGRCKRPMNLLETVGPHEAEIAFCTLLCLLAKPHKCPLTASPTRLQTGHPSAKAPRICVDGSYISSTTEVWVCQVCKNLGVDVIRNIVLLRSKYRVSIVSAGIRLRRQPRQLKDGASGVTPSKPWTVVERGPKAYRDDL